MTRAEEQRVRRRARQQGLKLLKARPSARRYPESGTFMLVDAMTGDIIASRDTLNGYGLSPEDVASYLVDADKLKSPTTHP
jgi:hypothetical protein